MGKQYKYKFLIWLEYQICFCLMDIFTANLFILVSVLVCIVNLISQVMHLSDIVGPSGVHALPLAAGRNEGGHYFR